MPEPTEAAYEAARAKYDAVVISRGAFGYRAGHYDAIRAAVDAVWPLAEAEGRRQAAADIRAELDRLRPADLRPFDGLVGMATGAAYNNAARIAEGSARPVTFVHPCGHSQVSPIPHLCPQCGTAEPWS